MPGLSGVKCESCGLLNSPHDASCERCGDRLPADAPTPPGATRATVVRSPAFWKALLIAFVIEAVVLALSLEPMLRSGMAHTASHPDSLSNNRLAAVAVGLSLLFHLPSLALAQLLGAPVLAPVFQIVFLTGLLYRLMRPRAGGS